MILRWFLDGTRLAQLARDNTIGGSTAYRYLHEGIGVLACCKPSLHAALLAAQMAGHTHISIDGTLLHTDRCHQPGPTPGSTCGGQASTTITAATSKWSPPRTAGRCGPPRCVPDGNMTPPACMPTTRCCPHYTHGPATNYPPWPTWATKAKTYSYCRSRNRRRPADRRATPAQLATRLRPSPRRTSKLTAEDHIQSTPADQPVTQHHRRNRRRRTRTPTHRTQPHHMITASNQPLLGKAQYRRHKSRRRSGFLLSWS
jgi:hypothetical protein